jgi:hypothetical protein
VVSRALIEMEEVLWRAYRGFSRIGEAARAAIIIRYGSVEGFMEEEFGVGR